MTHTTINAFGALALAAADRVRESVAGVAGHGASGPAALVALDGLAAGGSIDSLARILALTHSGTVRLVDRLAAARLVERRIGADARAVSLHLTPEGRRAARRVATAREAALEQLLAPLTTPQREQLNSLLSAMFGGLAPSTDDARRLCRLCDVDGCGRKRGTCPAVAAISEQD